MAIRELVELASRVAELERRFSGVMRSGAVEEVDPKKQVVRLNFGQSEDGQPFLSPWIPYAQVAGALKIHTPPSKGQQFTLLAPSGDWQQAVALPLTWSDNNKAPSDKGDEHVITYGDWTITLKGKTLDIKCGGTSWNLSEKGLKQNGGGIEHDGQLIDKTHKHIDSMPGPAKTGVPETGSI